MNFIFPNNVEITPGVWATPTVEQIARERSIQSSTIEWSLRNGSHLVRKMLESVETVRGSYEPPDGHYLVVDARVQRLMPGMYPSIPGWHCDAVPRSDYHAQPDLLAVRDDVRHFAMTLSTGPSVSECEFVTEPIAVLLNEQDAIWKQVHRGVERYQPKTTHLRDGDVATFTQTSIHRASPARVRGWRIFLRVATMQHPALHLGTAHQQQVYLISEENGW